MHGIFSRSRPSLVRRRSALKNILPRGLAFFVCRCYNKCRCGGLAQLVRAPASHAGGLGFESLSLHQKNGKFREKLAVFAFSLFMIHSSPFAPPRTLLMGNDKQSDLRSCTVKKCLVLAGPPVPLPRSPQTKRPGVCSGALSESIHAKNFFSLRGFVFFQFRPPPTHKNRAESPAFRFSAGCFYRPYELFVQTSIFKKRNI